MPARPSYMTMHTVTVVGDDGGDVLDASITPPTPITEPPLNNKTSFTMTTPAVMSVTEAINLPFTAPPAGGPGTPLDGLEELAGPIITLNSVSMPSSYLGDSLSGLNHPSTLPTTATGTFDIFPDIKIKIENDGVVAVAGVGTSVTTATIEGDILELNDWVVPWTPEAYIPKFDGSDYAKVKSEGYGRDNGAFIITFELGFGLKPPLAAHASSTTATFTIKILNNFSTDRERYKQDYENAYKSLDAVPDPSTWQ